MNSSEKQERIVIAFERQKQLIRETKEKQMRSLAKELGFSVKKKP